MMRLIDADELIEHMFLGTEYDKTVDDGMEKTEAMCKAFKCGWNDALASVMDYAPTVDAVPLEDYKSMERTVDKLTKALADAEPRRHGHWEVVDETEPRRYGCSVCKRLSWTEDNYCSYCGCKMDEVEDETN